MISSRWRWQIRHGAEILEEMLAPGRPLWDKAEEIKEVEHKCDFLTHEIIQRLHRTFVTPLDREDIFALARSLDDVMDAIDATATIVRLYQHRPRSGRAPASSPASSSTAPNRWSSPPKALEQQEGALPNRRSRSTASRTRPTAPTRARCGGCSRKRRDPIAIMKWKEILDFLEEATDRCEDVANVLEGVVVKHA